MHDCLSDKIYFTTLENLEEEISKQEPYLSQKRTKMRAMAQYRGFHDEYEYEGWRYFNNLGSENTRHILDIYSHNNSPE